MSDGQPVTPAAEEESLMNANYVHPMDHIFSNTPAVVSFGTGKQNGAIYHGSVRGLEAYSEKSGIVELSPWEVKLESAIRRQSNPE